MPDLFMFEKPLGMRDTLPDLFKIKHSMKQRMMDETVKYGYHFLETSSLEYYETVGKVSAIRDVHLFKLLDKDGHSLVLRPDMTSPIARVASSHLLKEGNPERLAYSANVFRAQEKEGGRPAEFEQFGIELIGDRTLSADAEVLCLLSDVLKVAGLERFHITLGHIGFVQDLLLHFGGCAETAGVMRKFLFEKNYVGFKQFVNQLPISLKEKEILYQLLDLKGGREILEMAEELTNGQLGQHAVNELKKLADILLLTDHTDMITFDLSLVSHMDYYTGILFEVSGENVGFPIGNGGRYNELYKQFGTDAPATGFGLRLDRLLEALNTESIDETPYCIIFHPVQQQKAMRRAAELRESGKRVVLQNVNGIKDVNTFTNNFSNIEFMIDMTDRSGGEG